jgi:hypothetical protein
VADKSIRITSKESVSKAERTPLRGKADSSHLETERIVYSFRRVTFRTVSLATMVHSSRRDNGTEGPCCAILRHIAWAYIFGHITAEKTTSEDVHTTPVSKKPLAASSAGIVSES